MPNDRSVTDFVYIGGPRCGSTWLSAVLSDHPDIFVPPGKELHFFNDWMPYDFEYRYRYGSEYYLSFFEQARSEQICGEISPFYYGDPKSAWRIHNFNPDMKIIVCLRDPADMLYSLYLLLRQREMRAASFEKELAVHPQLLNLCYFRPLLQPWFDLFPTEQIQVLMHGDIKRDPEGVSRQVFEFLGVDPDFEPPSLSTYFNLATDSRPTPLRQSRGYLLKALNSPFLLRLKKALVKGGLKDIRYYGSTDQDTQSRYSGLDPATRSWMADLLHHDLKRLQERLGRDLSAWKTVREGQLRTRSKRPACDSRFGAGTVADMISRAPA